MGQRKFLADAAAAMSLNRFVDNLTGHPRGDHFDHGDLLAGGLVADLVHHVGGMQGQQARLIDGDSRFGDFVAQGALVGVGRAEGDTRLGACFH